MPFSKKIVRMDLKPPKLMASLLCANSISLGKDLDALEEAKIDYLHIDMADGHFVPYLGIGIEQAKQIRAATHIPIDVHLLVSNPEYWVPRILDELAPSIVTFQIEATYHAYLLAQAIRDRGAMAGVALNPATSLSSIEYLLPELDLVLIMTTNPGIVGQSLINGMIGKIDDLKKLITAKGMELYIAVDGNVSLQHAPRMVEAGADCLVCGSSSIFDRQYGGIVEATSAFRQVLRTHATCLSSDACLRTGDVS